MISFINNGSDEQLIKALSTDDRYEELCKTVQPMKYGKGKKMAMVPVKGKRGLYYRNQIVGRKDERAKHSARHWKDEEGIVTSKNPRVNIAQDKKEYEEQVAQLNSDTSQDDLWDNEQYESNDTWLSDPINFNSEIYSDVYKDENGFRPQRQRNGFVGDWFSMSDDEQANYIANESPSLEEFRELRDDAYDSEGDNQYYIDNSHTVTVDNLGDITVANNSAALCIRRYYEDDHMVYTIVNLAEETEDGYPNTMETHATLKDAIESAHKKIATRENLDDEEYIGVCTMYTEDHPLYEILGKEEGSTEWVDLEGTYERISHYSPATYWEPEEYDTEDVPCTIDVEITYDADGGVTIGSDIDHMDDPYIEIHGYPEETIVHLSPNNEFIVSNDVEIFGVCSTFEEAKEIALNSISKDISLTYDFEREERDAYDDYMSSREDDY